MLSLQKRQNAHSWFLVVCLVILDDCNLFAASATAESVVLSLGNASLYEQRIAAYNDIALSSSASIANRTTFAQPILAFHGLFPLDEGPLQDLLDEVGGNSSNSDFAIVILVRVSYFTSKTSMATYYDGLILPILQTEHYWYTTEDGVVNDDTMSSENHMILWMSSAWLLQERHQWDLNDATLRQRLVHFLSLKITYGYYEFLSITYTPFSFAALLNLVDFCQDTEIQGMADQAIRRLISDYLLFVNDKGIQFSAAGRDYASRFLSPPYRQMMDGIIYLLTGLGDKPTRIFGFGSFLSTSSIDLSVEVSQWQSSVKTIYRYGHTLDESFEVNSALSKYDRIVFQFSQGSYGHPSFIDDSIDFIKHFGPISFKSNLKLTGDWMPPANWIPPLAELAKRISYGGVISGNEVCLYRQAGSMLSSVVNFWPGYAGLQVVPWMAVADVLPVWTESGRVFQNWLDKKSPIVHTHLPHVIQDDNIALIVYKPLVPLLAGVFGDVALNWPDSKFDETRFESMASAGFLKTAIGTVGRWIRGISGHQGSWVLGRKGDSYVAVFRPCGEKKQKGWYACNGVNGRQVWATAVGDSNLYGDFDAFATIVGAATVKESFRWRFGRSPVYETSLTIDGKTVSHDWL